MVTKKVVSGLLSTISFILIFFFLKFQILNLIVNPLILATIGMLLYLIAPKLAKAIEDRELKLFLHGIIITASSVFFFASMSTIFTTDFLNSYSIVLLVAGIILYLLKDTITETVTL